MSAEQVALLTSMACHGSEPLLRHQPWFSWFTRGRQDSSRGLPYRRGRFLYRKRGLPASCRSSVYGAAHRELRGNPVKSGYPFSRMFLFQGFPQSPFSLVYEPSGSYFGGGFPRSARGALREAFLPDLTGIRFRGSLSHLPVYRRAERSLGSKPLGGRGPYASFEAAGL